MWVESGWTRSVAGGTPSPWCFGDAARLVSAGFRNAGLFNLPSRLGKVEMRRLMPVGLWTLVLALAVLPVPGIHHLVGPRAAYAFDDPSGGSYEQDSGVGGGGAGTGASYGDPDGPQAKSQRPGPWRTVGGGGWRGASVYGQGQLGVVGRTWTIRSLILALRIYYLRF